MIINPHIDGKNPLANHVSLNKKLIISSLRVLCSFVILATILVNPFAVQAAGTRPFFQAPFPCGQVWDASTYENHWPDPDSIDLAERDGNLKNTSKGQPVLATAAGTVLKSFTTADGEYRVYIDHGNGWITHYIHMEPDDTSPMYVGRHVAQGEQIGRTSNSGAEAVHQHYTQLADGEAVRIKFNGTAIDTHAGNKNSYKTWEKETAEDILSQNCAGNTFMGWSENGNRYHLIYTSGNSSKALTKILRTKENGSQVTTFTGNWSKGYTHFTPFHIKYSNSAYALLYKSSTGFVKFVRMRSNGTGVTTLSSKTWYAGWTHFVPFTLNGYTYFLAYDSVHGYMNIDRINAVGDGSTNVYKTNWAQGRTQIVPFTLGPTQYMLLYRGGDGWSKIIKITTTNGQVSVNSVWEGSWSTGYTNLVPVIHEGARYLLGYKAATGFAKVMKFKSKGQGVETIRSMSWTKSWTAFAPYSQDNKGHILIYKTGTGLVKTLRLEPGGDGVETIYTSKWKTGWK